MKLHLQRVSVLFPLFLVLIATLAGPASASLTEPVGLSSSSELTEATPVFNVDCNLCPGRKAKGRGLIADEVKLRPADLPRIVQRDGPMLIWVTINARGGEEPWEACRRKYQRDVYSAAGGPGTKVRCRIDHSRIYSRGDVRQNFNN